MRARNITTSRNSNFLTICQRVLKVTLQRKDSYTALINEEPQWTAAVARAPQQIRSKLALQPEPGRPKAQVLP